MATPVENKELLPSVSGTGLGFYETRILLQENYKVSFNDNGEVIITGRYVHSGTSGPSAELIKQLPDVFAKAVTDVSKVHWTDLAAVLAVSKTARIVDPKQLPWYFAGRRSFDQLELITILKEIQGSGNQKDWNKIIKAKAPLPADDTKQDDSPANPASPYYSPGRPVFAYDPDNGIIIYKDGEIVWTKNGARYIARDMGIVWSYDKANGLVKFENGAVLNLKTLELTNPDQTKTIIKQNIDAWYVTLAKKLLANTKLLWITLGVLIVAIFLKNKRNEGKRRRR